MPNADLSTIAREIEGHLIAIRAMLRQPAEAEFARGNLTGPQRAVMQALFHSGGLRLKDLSSQVGLAHSTVSGIVDRLERQVLVERKPDEKDRRATIIVVTKGVRDFMRDRYPALTLDPVTAALRRATPGERTRILAGLRTLRCAVEATR